MASPACTGILEEIVSASKSAAKPRTPCPSLLIFPTDSYNALCLRASVFDKKSVPGFWL